jgi:hypothetical protein
MPHDNVNVEGDLGTVAPSDPQNRALVVIRSTTTGRHVRSVAPRCASRIFAGRTTRLQFRRRYHALADAKSAAIARRIQAGLPDASLISRDADVASSEQGTLTMCTSEQRTAVGQHVLCSTTATGPYLASPADWQLDKF